MYYMSEMTNVYRFWSTCLMTSHYKKNLDTDESVILKSDSNTVYEAQTHQAQNTDK